MVLVDAMHPDQYNRFPPELALPAASQFDVLLPLVSVGLSRVFTPFPTEPALPTPQRQQIAALNASTKSMSATLTSHRPPPWCCVRAAHWPR